MYTAVYLVYLSYRCGVWFGAVDKSLVRARSKSQDLLAPLEPQSRFGDKPVKLYVICPQNGTAVLKGVI